MNVIAAPFLYAAKSETEAFALFSFFIKKECPSYVKPTMEGVHRGLKLVDQCLETVDRELYLFLKEKYLSAELYAFPCEFIALPPNCSYISYKEDVLTSIV